MISGNLEMQMLLPASEPACMQLLLLLHCTAVDCGDPGTVTNGQHAFTTTTYNSVVTFTCNTGYTQPGSNRRTCQANGQWSGSLPRCNRKFLHAFSIV